MLIRDTIGGREKPQLKAHNMDGHLGIHSHGCRALALQVRIECAFGQSVVILCSNTHARLNAHSGHSAGSSEAMLHGPFTNTGDVHPVCLAFWQ